MSEQNDMLRLLYENETRLKQTETKEVARFNRGTVNPTSWPNNVPFYRTDLGLWIYFDGTRWLTENEYMIPVQALTAFPGPGIVAGTITALRTDYAPYFTRVETTATVTAPNNATNYWQVDIITINLAFAAVDVVYAYDTHLDTAGTRTLHATSAPAIPAPTNRQFIRGRFTTVLAPGALEMTISAFYRLIIP